MVEDITERKMAEEKIKRLNDDLRKRNFALEFANKELEAFTYSASHDLLAPLRQISGFVDLVMKNIRDKLDDKGKHYLSCIHDGSKKMSHLIVDLLNLSRISRREIQRRDINMSAIATSIADELRKSHPGRSVDVAIKEGLTVLADPGLIEIVLSNLLGNAWKFTAKTEHARIEFGTIGQNGKPIYYVRDMAQGSTRNMQIGCFCPSKDFIQSRSLSLRAPG